MKKSLIFIFLIIIFIGILWGNSTNLSKPYEKIGYALDTQIRIVVYDKGADSDIVNKAYNEILRLEKILSNFDEKSETYILNKNKELNVSYELKSVILSGIEITNKTFGNYDLTIYPLSEIWNYKNKKVPSLDAINDAKSLIEIENVKVSGSKVTLLNNAKIDVSSLAKGYIADSVIDLLKNNGIKNALVDAGGNIKVMGSANGKNSSFKIGIKDPNKKETDSIGYIQLKDKSIVTSGIYERNFTYEGKLYHHIINPHTGYPSDSDVISASVICENSMIADAYATALVVMGADEGLKLIEQNEDLECIMVKKDNTVILSSGIKDFNLTDDNYKIGG